MADAFGFVGLELDGFSSPLSRRQNGCVKCDDVSLTCDCPPNEKCQNVIPMTCKDCPYSYCVAATDATPLPSGEDSASPMNGGDSTNVGAIVGGVIAGLVAVAVVTYLVWRFCIKNRRGEEEYEPEPHQWPRQSQQTSQHHQSYYEHSKEQPHDDAATMQSKRTSTHTVHSIASTVLTRASNIIQIAYIPGVTNRTNPSSPTVLVPPVPPIPREHSETGNSSPYEDHFFMPGDLRNSTYSGISYNSDRTSYARTSYAPRSSVASTIYGTNAVVSPLPAQRGNFLKPSLVSVKSRAGSSHSDDAPPVPPVPHVEYDKYEQQPPPSPAFSIGSTFLKNANASTATPMRPQVVRVGSARKKGDAQSRNGSMSSDGTKVASSPQPAGEPRAHTPSSILDEFPSPGSGGPSPRGEGPFADPAPSIRSDARSGLSAVMEEPRRTSEHSATSTSRGRSPFGDENRVRGS